MGYETLPFPAVTIEVKRAGCVPYKPDDHLPYNADTAEPGQGIFRGNNEQWQKQWRNIVIVSYLYDKKELRSDNRK